MATFFLYEMSCKCISMKVIFGIKYNNGNI